MIVVKNRIAESRSRAQISDKSLNSVESIYLLVRSNIISTAKW